jgi:hypothetical protein
MVVALLALHSLKETLNNVTSPLRYSHRGRCRYSRIFPSSHPTSPTPAAASRSSSPCTAPARTRPLILPHRGTLRPPRTPPSPHAMVPQPRRIHLLGRCRLELQTPDWIVPHITHVRLRLISIQDINPRLLFDAEGPLAMDTLNDAPFFPLLEHYYCAGPRFRS